MLWATFYSLPHWQKVNEHELAFHQGQHWKLGTELPLKITRCMCFNPWHTGLEISPSWAVQLPRNSRKLQLLHWPENGFNLYCFILPVGNYPLFSSMPAKEKKEKKIQQSQQISLWSLPCHWIPAYHKACMPPLSKVWIAYPLQATHPLGHSTHKFPAV